MADLNDHITPKSDPPLVAGDDYDIERIMTSLPDARTVTTAWMTVRRRETLDATDDTEVVFQKEITSVDQPTVGQITDTGTGSGEEREATVLFRLQSSETRALAAVTRYWDVQVQLDDGTTRTIFAGTIRALQDVTKATSPS